MSQSADAAIDRWYDIVTGRTTKGPLRASNIVVNGDLLYSYGTHFELARPLRDRKGEIQGFLLNGDSYSVTTSTHQSHVRSVLSREETVIIPHSALNSAGIDLETVQIVHVKPDTFTTTHHRTTERPPRSKWVDHPVYGTRRLTDDEVKEILDKRHQEAMAMHNRNVRYRDEAVARGDKTMADMWNRTITREGPPLRPDKLPDHEMTKRYVVRHDRRLHRNGREWGDEVEVTTLPDGTLEYSWDVQRHWLGEALVRARVTWTTRHECRWCQGTGWGIGPSWNRWDPSMQCMECRGFGNTTKVHHRWAYYLSGFDHEEARPLYFFAELPRGSKPATVAEAYEALKPDPVRLAEQMGRPIFRQGDIFGVPTRMDAKALRAQGARIERRVTLNSPKPGVTLPYVLGTNHTATEVAYLPNGVTLARGTMYHDPSGRRPDHARRRIGDGKSWHVVIKNTVPVSVRR